MVFLASTLSIYLMCVMHTNVDFADKSLRFWPKQKTTNSSSMSLLG